MPVLFALIFTLFSVSLQAAPSAMTEHAKVTLVSEAAAITPGQPFNVAFDFELEDHWHIYWKNPGDSGLAATVHWELPSGFAVGSLQWPTPEKIAVEGLMNYGYEGSPSLIQRMIPPNGLEGEAFSQEGNEVILTAKLEWLICKEICIPESAEVSLTLPISTKSLVNEGSFDARLAMLPAPLSDTAYFEQKDDAIYLQLPYEVKEGAYFYPEVGGVIEHVEPQTLLKGEGVSVLKLSKGMHEIDGNLGGVLVAAADRFAVQAEPGMVVVPQAAAPVESLSLVTALLFALLGGVLLNAMPCVFPVLSLKALSISRKAQTATTEVRKQGLAYLVGVVVSFLVLGGVMIALKTAGHTLGWGFQLQSPVFVTAMLFIFFLLGLSLVGMFHLPVLMGNAAQDAEQKESTKGSFLTGGLAVLVATPCAVPFMAPAVGYAFAQPTTITLLIMVLLGVGLALPYLLLAWFPVLHKRLPKPGAWMNSFKEFMAFPMFASAAWLLWVLAQQVSLDILAVILFALVGLAFLIWIGKAWAKLLALLLVGFTLYSTYCASCSSNVDSYKNLSEPFTPQRLSELRATGKPVFVNATAAWCITCKVNERVALRDPKIAESFKAQGITYLVADWTNRDDAITDWLTRYGRSGVPLYVYYPADGVQEIVLPQLLTTSTILDIIKEN
ncbi:MAG: protein-disulfide reductase DsbD family protein [Rickettsiales bacterium]|nr:protein-disulfide reductase DsbD family protein [Rickettsiales bacterium]